MSQQSNPATLREAGPPTLELGQKLKSFSVECKHGGIVAGVDDYYVTIASRGLEMTLWKDEVQRAALAASGTHYLPPSIPDGSMATASGVPLVGNFLCECESPYVGARIAGTPNRCERCRGLIDAVAMTGEAPQQLQGESKTGAVTETK